MSQRCFALVVGAVATLTVGAARADTSTQSQLWAATFVTARVTGEAKPVERDRGLGLWLDVHRRHAPDRDVSIVRPALGYRLNAESSAWAGYAIVPTELDEKPTVVEHRWWQQLVYQPTFGRLTLQVRPRFEQRFLEGSPGVNHRARLMGRAHVRLPSDVAPGVAIWGEVFWRLDGAGWAGEAGFDQNRAFVGPTWAFGPARAEVGYLNLFQVRKDGSRLLAHAAALNVFVAF